MRVSDSCFTNTKIKASATLQPRARVTNDCKTTPHDLRRNKIISLWERKGQTEFFDFLPSRGAKMKQTMHFFWGGVQKTKTNAQRKRRRTNTRWIEWYCALLPGGARAGGGCYDFVYSSVGLGERVQFQRHTIFFEGQNAHSFEIIPWSSSCPSPTSTGQKKILKKNFGPFFQQKILICQTQKEKNRPDEKKTGGTKKYIPPSPPRDVFKRENFYSQISHA